MNELASILKALSDPNRLRIIYALNHRELCGCELQELIGISGAAISQHMNILIQNKLCTSTKKGKWVYYRLIDHKLLVEILTMLEMKNDEILKQDILQLLNIKKYNEITCK